MTDTAILLLWGNCKERIRTSFIECCFPPAIYHVTVWSWPRSVVQAVDEGDGELVDAGGLAMKNAVKK